MPLSIAERKYRMPHGGQKKAARLAGLLDKSYVSRVMSGEILPKSKRAKLKLRRAQVAIARVMGLRVEDVFSPDELARGAQSEPLARSA